MSLTSELAPPTVRRSSSKRTALPADDPPLASPAEAAALPLPEESGASPESPQEDVAGVTRLSDRVRFARMLANLSKAELARRVGVCLSAAVQWELTNGTSPTVNNLAKIATIASVGFEWLATGRGSPKLQAEPQILANPEDLEFEIRLLVAVRAIARERRDIIVDFARSLAAS
jgi:transcriptional regulator with XRE-family HTH domain